MKTLFTVSVLAALAGFASGYRTGSLDESMRSRSQIASLKEKLNDQRAFSQELSDERVRLIIQSNRKGN